MTLALREEKNNEVAVYIMFQKSALILEGKKRGQKKREN
jgi:hypothetical protein